MVKDQKLGAAKTDEAKLIIPFISEAKRERYCGFLASPKRREKFLEELYHFGDFNPEVIVRLAGKDETIDVVLKELRARGASDSCYIISTDKEVDRRNLSLLDALQQVFACIEGTIIFCGPNIAYYEGEAPKNRYILHKKKV
jgi:hypothetical protein